MKPPGTESALGSASSRHGRHLLLLAAHEPGRTSARQVKASAAEPEPAEPSDVGADEEAAGIVPYLDMPDWTLEIWIGAEAAGEVVVIAS